LGSAWTALASWVVARRASGTCVLRFENLDTSRVVAGAYARIQDDLRWLGLDWDGDPVHQSERVDLYRRTVEQLAAAGWVYPCDCSRAEIARAPSAPHPGEESVYPGLCRDRDPNRAMKRPPALRLRIPETAVVSFEDGIAGQVTQRLSQEVGDFVLRRGDGVFAYQIAVVVDDLAMGITDVVRAADLVASTPRQIWLAQLLGARPPRYVHVPLVVTREGARLEKRTRGITIRELRESGVRAERIVGSMAYGLGLADTDRPATASEVARSTAERAIEWRGRPWPVPEHW
jgi:glutamyl-tRNA synthetase